MSYPIPKIIFDTDIGWDCDDAGALALLHRLCDWGEADLLATVHCYTTPYVAGCLDAINRYCGRSVPVGLNYTLPRNNPDTYAKAICETFPNRYPASVIGTPDGPEDSLALMRRLLAEAEDHSVIIVTVGDQANLARLVTSEADEYSPLCGVDLITRKVARTVVMGGRFYEGWPMVIYSDNVNNIGPVTTEWNIYDHIPAARTVAKLWPGELVYSSTELGTYIVTMKGRPGATLRDDPGAVSYGIHNGGVGRSSWDHTAVLEAVRPDTYWNYRPYGRVSVDNKGITSHTIDETGKQTFLLPRVDYATVADIIDDIMGTPKQ